MELELVFNWVIKSSIMASILAVLILLVNYALRNKLDAKWQYAIWMLLIIRLLMPYDIQSPWSLYSLLPKKSVTIQMVNQANIMIPDINTPTSNISGKDIQLTNNKSFIDNQSNTKSEEPISKNLSIGGIVAILWLVGALILAILTLITNLRFYLLVRREPAVTDARMSKLMQECTNKIGIRRNLPIIITNRIDAPCLYGIVSPKLLLPKSLINRLNDENIRHIFIHELSHYKRKDILINWLAVTAQIVHWFNPLIWYSFARMREDCELACDADTLCSLMPEEYQSYGLSIISLATPARCPLIPGTTGFLGNKSNYQIKRRITMIKFFKKPTLTWTWTAVVIFISLGLVGFTNSISNAAPETGISTPKQTTQSSPSSSVADGSFDKPLVASEESIAAQANKITSNVWNLDIKSIEFTVGAEDQKFANVEFSMTNTSSLDKAFTPSGKIVSLVGTSGQTYESPMHHSLAKGYTESKSDRIKMDPQYKPGKFKFGIGLMVDNSEENFTKVIYQDESGKNFEIPIQGISPKIKPLPTDGK